MRPLKDFDSFMKEGVVDRRSPDPARARSLLKETEISYNSILEVEEKIGVKDGNANYVIKNCYDIIMELVRAKMLLAGFDSSGRGAHEAEVSYMRKLGFSEGDVRFADQLRYFRNGITYYGRICDKRYAESVIEFMKKCYERMS